MGIASNPFAHLTLWHLARAVKSDTCTRITKSYQTLYDPSRLIHHSMILMICFWKVLFETQTNLNGDDHDQHPVPICILCTWVLNESDQSHAKCAKNPKSFRYLMHLWYAAYVCICFIRATSNISTHSTSFKMFCNFTHREILGASGFEPAADATVPLLPSGISRTMARKSSANSQCSPMWLWFLLRIAKILEQPKTNLTKYVCQYDWKNIIQCIQKAARTDGVLLSARVARVNSACTTCPKELPRYLSNFVLK